MATIRKYYKYSNQPNVDFIGTPTIENGIVGGYSTTSYQRLPAHPLNINNYEILIKVKWTAFNDGRVIGNSITNIKSPQFEGPTDSAGTGAWFGHPNSAFNTWIGVTLSYTFILNTWYYIKLCWTGTVINANISLDGKEWIFCGETACTNHGWVQPCHFGADVASYIFSGFIDYKECYIKVNNEMYWHGTTIVEGTSNDYDFYEDYQIYKCYEQQPEIKYYKYINEDVVSPIFSSEYEAILSENYFKFLTASNLYYITHTGTNTFASGTVMVLDCGRLSNGIKTFGYVGVVSGGNWPGLRMAKIEASEDYNTWSVISNGYGGRGDYLTNPLQIPYPNKYRYLRLTFTNDDTRYGVGGANSLRVGYVKLVEAECNADDDYAYSVTIPGGYKTIAPITRRYYKEIGNNIVESNVLDYDNSSKAPLYQAISD